MRCGICGSELITSGCPSEWKHRAAVNESGGTIITVTGTGSIDTGEIHRAPLLKELAALRRVYDALAQVEEAKALLREVEGFGIGLSKRSPYLEHAMLCAVNSNGLSKGPCNCGLDKWHTAVRAAFLGRKGGGHV